MRERAERRREHGSDQCVGGMERCRVHAPYQAKCANEFKRITVARAKCVCMRERWRGADVCGAMASHDAICVMCKGV
eukprot:5913867-Pleurochrysis_carterae.AAC.2